MRDAKKLTLSRKALNNDGKDLNKLVGGTVDFTDSKAPVPSRTPS